MINTNDTQEKWIQWVKDLQAVAQAGLYYGGTDFDKERYQQIRDIAAEMMVDITEMPIDKVKDLFCNETGYQTPKLVTRAAVFKEDRILLVKENYGKWALPGGWVDPGVSVLENAVKEVQEESGFSCTADFIIAVQEKDRHNERTHPFPETAIFVHCTPQGGSFEENLETIGCRFFGRDEIAGIDFDAGKTSPEQIEMCFAAHDNPDVWKVQAD